MAKDKLVLRQELNDEISAKQSGGKSVAATVTNFFRNILRGKVQHIVDSEAVQSVGADQHPSLAVETQKPVAHETFDQLNLLDALTLAVESFRGDERIVADAILEQVEKNGGPSVLGLETYQGGEDIIRRGEPLPSEKGKPQGEGVVRIFLNEGSVDIFLPSADGGETLVETVRGYSLLGEMSALRLSKCRRQPCVQASKVPLFSLFLLHFCGLSMMTGNQTLIVFWTLLSRSVFIFRENSPRAPSRALKS